MKLSFRFVCVSRAFAVAGFVIGSVGWSSAQNIVMDLTTESARENTVNALEQQAAQRKQEAFAVAQDRGWPVQGVTSEDRKFELMQLDPETGRPLYNITMNKNAAISTAADLVRNTAPYNVNGSGLLIGVWDGGSVLANHQEFVAPDRVTVKDGSSVNYHATHVAGTIGAKGVDPLAEGMAPSVDILSYDWSSDDAEMVSEAATAAGQTTKMNLSNHSYGTVSGWSDGDYSGNSGWHWFGAQGEREDASFGQYSSAARSWDDIVYNARYYLPFKSAGNDRNEGPHTSQDGNITIYRRDAIWNWVSSTYSLATDPYNDGSQDGGYDTITDKGNAKNIMTVGAIRDAQSGGTRDLSPTSPMVASFSGWGPTDDGRIKPDIVANGILVYSTLETSTSAYGSMSGTSMSCPNASGSAVLLVEYFRNVFPGNDMLASTLKGLIIHTADDMGTAGPDYIYGWGMMNTLAAADHILFHANATGTQAIVENTLDSGTSSESYNFTWDGSNSISATLCWTDPAGTSQSGLNATNLALVNDLDLRIISPDGTTNFPFVLDPSSYTNAATTGDNFRDNVEQVRIALPIPGTHTVVVSHKGALTNGQQEYSLLLSGALPVGASGVPQSITFESIPLQDHADNVVPLHATASSGLPVTFSIQSGPGTITDQTNMTFTAEGTVTVAADQAGDDTYAAASTVYQDIHVLGNQPFEFRAIALTNSVSLRWTNPYLAGVSNQAVLIRAATNTFPQTQGEGTAVFSGTNTTFSYMHSNLVSGTSYYYTIWTSDDGVTYSEPPSE